ncbi:MAG: hypothetical protein P1V19_20480 [Gimesia sp.]|nr:hypothetical protein [Gimesia sp.]
MSGPVEPQWDLLPDFPEEFFELSEEYDLRDLKRKYNSYIRQFKPEKFPEEFQKIRAAFECLNDALRYQEPPRSQTVKADLQFDWDFNDATDPDQPPGNLPIDPQQQSDAHPPDHLHQSHASEGLAAQSVPLHLHERVNSESLPKLYEDLQAKELKTPYDFYALAVFSDILEDRENSFPDWLLAGLKVHHEEAALFELLRQYFATEPSHERTVPLLETASQIIRSDRFYYLTERAWDEQLKSTPFSTFRQNLLSCESNLLDHEVDHILVFYLHILKTAIWKADEDWINATFSFMEENYDRLPYWVEEELEFLYQLKEYREQRVKFLNGNSVRTTIDQAIVDYCTKSEQDADRSFLERQHELVLLEEDLLREFEVPAIEFESIQILWEKIAADIYDRIDPVIFDDDETTLEKQTQKLAYRIVTEGMGRRYRIIHHFNVILGLGMFGSLGLMVYFLLFILESFWMTIAKIFGLLFANFVILLVYGIIEDKFVLSLYRKGWRFEIMQFYQTNWFPLLELADALEELKSIKIGDEEFDGLDKIANWMRKDIGLCIYVTAQRLLAACQ